MDKTRELLFEELKTNLLAAGKGITEVSDWQDKVDKLPGKELRDALEKLMVEIPAMKEKLERLMPVIGLSEATISVEQALTKAAVDPTVRKALAPLLENQTGHVILNMDIGSDYSYLRLKNLLHILFDNALNPSPEMPSDEIRCAFIINNEMRIKGRVLSMTEEYKRNFPLVQVYKTKEALHYKFFGEPAGFLQGYPSIVVFNGSFWIYRFMTERGEETYLLTQEKLELEDSIIHGMPVQVADPVRLTAMSKVKASTTLIFVYKQEIIKPKITDGGQFWKTVKMFHSVDEVYAKFFGKYPQPAWFKEFITSWNLAGKLDNMPTHLSLLSGPATGKTRMLNCLSVAYGEEITGGGTVKGLIPSFAMGKPDEGYFLRCKRIGMVDEFLHIIVNSTRALGKGDFDGGSASLLKVLEHAEDAYRSAYGSIKARPRMYALFCSNIKPYEHIQNLVDLHSKLNVAFMSRIVWYIFDKEHVDFINAHKLDIMTMKREDLMPCHDDTMMAIVDFARLQLCEEIKLTDIEVIYEKWKPYVPSELIDDIYDSRMKLHIYRMLDGYGKLKSITEQRGRFVVTPDDVKNFDEIFGRIVKSWSCGLDMEKLTPAMKMPYLPAHEREIVDFIQKNPGIDAPTLKMSISSIGVDIARRLASQGMLTIVHNERAGLEQFYAYDSFIS